MFVLRSNVMGIRTHSHKITVIFSWGWIPHQPLALGHWGPWASPSWEGSRIQTTPRTQRHVRHWQSTDMFREAFNVALSCVLCISAPWTIIPRKVLSGRVVEALALPLRLWSPGRCHCREGTGHPGSFLLPTSAWQVPSTLLDSVLFSTLASLVGGFFFKKIFLVLYCFAACFFDYLCKWTFLPAHGLGFLTGRSISFWLSSIGRLILIFLICKGSLQTMKNKLLCVTNPLPHCPLSSIHDF